MFKIAVEALRDHWREGEKNMGQESLLAKKELAEVEKKVGQLMDRIVATDSPSVIKAYEEHIKNLEMRKAGLAEIVKNCGRPLKTFDQTYRTAQAIAAIHKIIDFEENKVLGQGGSNP